MSEERRRQGLHWRAWRAAWPRYQRLVAWWHRYSGSVAFVSLVLVVTYGSWIDQRRISRLENVEVAQNTARSERLADQIELERRDRAVEQAQTEHEHRQRAQLDSIRGEIMRVASIQDCERINVLRLRLRDFAAQQLAVAQRMPLRETTLQEYVQIMGDYQQTLVHLHRDLHAIDCNAAYPAVQ